MYAKEVTNYLTFWQDYVDEYDENNYLTKVVFSLQIPCVCLKWRNFKWNAKLVMSLTQASPFRWLDSWLPEFKSTRPHLQISNWIDQRQLKFSKMLCYIDGWVAYLVRASSSHKRALATTTATNVKKAKQLRKCRISFLCVHFLAINARLQREILKFDGLHGTFLSLSDSRLTLKISCRNSSTIKKNCVIWNNPDKIWKGIHLCVFFSAVVVVVTRD